ncbi:HdeA/HdeB family chaperone [Bradyrhizobium brasilense]|uniref:HdeA/HdeB family chaperone n=1 Tax=Bradyrhizobium brasilense TaxID=1419277 RepID=UPI0024B245F5|nr:HdeA/HdeB family chaperone [Bradyrhizobium australafricanum]WFU35091.1 HdeA/HdeB family chaperone [Bradyrhizobium australafricanum]
MKTENKIAVVLVAGALMLSPAKAQTPLSAYADANGFDDVQALTCAQPAGTYQEDADMLAAWYSGWYNGLAKKHYAHITRAKSGEHQLIVYCKAHPATKIIEAVDLLLKNEGK